jgi:hypothetical protein
VEIIKSLIPYLGRTSAEGQDYQGCSWALSHFQASADGMGLEYKACSTSKESKVAVQHVFVVTYLTYENLPFLRVSNELALSTIRPQRTFLQF